MPKKIFADNLGFLLPATESLCHRQIRKLQHHDRRVMLQDLKSDGYAVVEGVLDKETCERIKDGMWDHAEYISMGRISRSDPTTWKTELQNTFFPNHGMLMQHQYWGHSQVVWDIRQDQRVVKAYEEIYAETKFTVSYDGVSFGLAPEVTGIGWHHKPWLHLDQGWGKTNYIRETYQSWVTAFDIDEGDATLQVLKGSHKLHEAFAKEFGLTTHRKNWYKLTEEEVDWYIEQGCTLVNITCKAGAQVLWDSKTVHAGRAPLKRRANAGRHRFVIYLCYTPYHWLTTASKKKKLKALRELRMTSHLPHYPTLFAKQPWTRGKQLLPLASPKKPVFNRECTFLPLIN